MQQFDKKYGNFIYAIISNQSLNDDERSNIIADMISEFKGSYPNLEHTATKTELSETELRLIKEIEDARAEIKNTELKLTKEIEEVRGEVKGLELKLTKEIEDVRAEIKNTELKLTKEIEDVRAEIKNTELKLTKEIEEVRGEIKESKYSTIKWIVGMMFAQVIAIGGLFFTAFKLFASQ
jgi:phenylalanyl-tRNA synthetase alpha subunit